MLGELFGPILNPGGSGGITSNSLFVYNVRNYGAKGDGTTNDYAAFLAAYNAAVAAGGGIVFMPAGTYILNTIANGLNWTSGLVQLWGVGDASIIKAGSTSSTSTLNVQIPGGGRGLFQNFIVDGGGFSANPIHESISVENSVGTRWRAVKAQNASTTTNYCWVNSKCEDNSYEDCATPGNEGASSGVPYAMQVSVPFGLVRFIGSEFFGRVDITAQQCDAYASVLGPITTNNNSALNTQVINLFGCYIYDGGVSDTQCISSVDNLVNIEAIGCVFIMQNQVTWANGNIPSGVLLHFKNCSWVQGSATGTTVALITASGAGLIKIEGGSVTVSNASTVNLFNPVSAPTTIALMPAKCAGVTATGTSRVLSVSPPAFPLTTVTYTNAFQSTVTYSITNGTGALTIAIDGTTALVLPASQTYALRLDPGQTFTPTYASGTPTWKLVAAS